MPNFIRVYSGADGQSHLEEFEPDWNPFVDTEGAHGEGTPLESATGITIRRNPPGYFLDFHCAPRRQQRDSNRARTRPSEIARRRRYRLE